MKVGAVAVRAVGYSTACHWVDVVACRGKQLSLRVPGVIGPLRVRATTISLRQRSFFQARIREPLMGGKPVCMGSDPAAARSQTSGGLCVFDC